MTWSASIFTADLSQRIDLSDRLFSFRGNVRHLAGGEWEAALALTVWDDLLEIWPTDNAAPPLGLAIQTPGHIVMSGAVNDATLTRNGANTTVTVTGVDEFAALASRLVYPQPADPPPWATNAYHVVTGQASAAIAEIISKHVGPTARAERQQPGLRVLDSGAGPTGTWQYRLVSVAEAVADIATEADLAVHVRRRLDGQLDVFVRPTLVRTDLVLDDTVIGNYTLKLSEATATTVVAGGSGEGTARLFTISGDGAAGAARREDFSAQTNIGTTAALQRSSDATLASSSATTTFSGSLAAEAADRYVWRTHYDLGDHILLRFDTTNWDVQVTAVGVTIDGDGLRMAPTLGIAPKHALAQLLADVADLQSRLSNIEVA